MVKMVENMVMVDNVNMEDAIDMMNLQKDFDYLSMLLDTSVWTRWTS